jgi:hypothetical protein
MIKTRSSPAIVSFLAAFAATLYAKGPELSPAEGLENWKYELDLSAYASGKYNLVVEGVDKAGNITRAAPMNIYVDPKSDLPRVSIINPTPFERVGGDLNIVGTASDDDGVGRVEVSVDGGDFVAAEGGEFWSLLLKTEGLEEGRRTIDVRAVDMYGVEGPPSRVQFDLDLTKPRATVESPAIGTLVSGQIRLTGSAFDANGIRSLEVSRDGGAWSAVDLKKDDKTGTTKSFSIQVDTKKLSDGPHVFRLKSTDGVGSVSSDAYLLYVDNTKPVLEIVRPAENTAVHGVFALVGAARDTIGLKRLTYRIGSEQQGEIELIKGDPYFAAELDVGAVKGDSTVLVLEAEDTIGNVTRLEKKIKIDRSVDKPVLRVLGPPAGAQAAGEKGAALPIVRSGGAVWGTISDDDGVSAFSWSLDGGASSEVPCNEVFFLSLPDIASGRHVLSLTPFDSNKTPGDPVSFAFMYDRGPGSVVFDRIASAKAGRDFVQGIESAVDSGEFLEGYVNITNTLASLSYSIAGGASKPLPLIKDDKGQTQRFRIPIDTAFPYGFVVVSVRAGDSFGNNYGAQALVYITDYSTAREEPGFRFSDPRLGEDGKIAFRGAGSGTVRPLQGAFYGGQLASIRLEPKTDIVEVSFEGRVVTIRPVKDGTTAPTRLYGKTTGGREFSSDAMIFSTDSTPPSISINSPADGSWIKSGASVKGTAKDAGGGPVELSWRILPDGQKTSAAVGSDGSFSFDVGSAAERQGPISIAVDATDRAGNTATTFVNIGIDSAAPVIRFLSPEDGAEIRGPECVAALIEDVSGAAAVEYAEDGVKFEPIAWTGRYFVHTADLAANPRAAYRILDKAGNAVVARPSVRIAEVSTQIRPSATLSVEPGPGEARIELAGAAGALKVSVLLPALREPDYAALGADARSFGGRFAGRLLAQGALSLKGQATLDSPVKSVSVSRDEGATYTVLASNKDERTAKTALAFSLNSESSKLQAEEARWTIKVEDFSGNVFISPLSIYFDTKAPVVSLINPLSTAVSMPGPFPLVFKIEDDIALASADISIGPGTSRRETLDIVPGSRYFARIIDPASADGKGAQQAIAVAAKDIAGNLSQFQLKAAYDAAGDAPVLALDLFEERAGGIVSGSVSDDDGIPAVSLSIDGQSPVLFEAGAFALRLDDLSSGKHEIVFNAKSGDSWLVLGRRSLSMPGGAAAFSDITIMTSSGKDAASVAWTPGGEYALGATSVLSGVLAAFDPKTTVTASFNGGAPVQASVAKSSDASSALRFSVPIPAALPYSRVMVELRAKDSAGLESMERIELHKILPPAAGVDTAEGIRFADERIVEEEGEKRILLTPGDKITGRFNGRPILSAQVRPATPVVTVDFDGGFVSVHAASEGVAQGVKLEVKTVDGEVFTWGPFSVYSDASAPMVTVAAPLDGEWLRNELPLDVSAEDPNGIISLEITATSSSASTETSLARIEAGALKKNAALDSVGEGAFRIDITARDGAGRETRVTRYAIKDTTPPVLTQVNPAVGESVNGMTTFSGEAQDAGRLASVSFSLGTSGAVEDVAGLDAFHKNLDLARIALPLADGGGFIAVDKAGNRAVLAPALVVDVEKDKPVIEIHAPEQLEVLRGDFVVSGVAYDDDGLSAAYYRIDGGPWSRIEMEGASFSVAIRLADTTDNEHVFEARAEDIFGIQGDVVSLTYRISKEEPRAAMNAPSISAPVRGRVRLSGLSSDANGVKEVAVSVDNRTSFAKPAGLETWGVDLDTATLSDGIHAVAIRPIDGYDTPGFYATMISVDNTPPKAQLDLPLDGRVAAGTLDISGRISDNMALASGRIEVARLGSSSPPLLSVDIGTEKIVQRSLDISSLDPGLYSVRLIVVDRAGNESLASRDVTIVSRSPVDVTNIVFPADGSKLSGRLRIQGYATSGGAVTVLADGAILASVEPSGLGWFSVDLASGSLTDGDHVLTAKAVDRQGRSIESPAARIEYSALGPWVSIDSFTSGQYVPYRPFLEGRAGWEVQSPPEGDKVALAAYKKELDSKKVVAVDISLDDGKSFERAKGAEKWKFRLETQLYKEGSIHVIARATFADGTTAVSKALFFLDKTPPQVEVLMPEEGGRFNGKLQLAGRSYDENGMAFVGVALRKGDKANYQIPSFIQGLYIDGQVLGATEWQGGAGLTFFDDNVKLQAIYGSAPEIDAEGEPQSFYGDVFGGKLIANVAFLPFESLFGADWSFLSASLGLGAGFSYFTQTQAGTGLLVGSIFGQIEFPKITFSSMSVFRTVSFYSECQLWVLSSVVEGGFIPKLSFGVRVGVF